MEKNGLTEVEEVLIEGLALYDLDEETQMGLFLFLKTEEQQLKMIDYMLEHKDATGQEIMKAAAKILFGRRN